MTCDPLPVLYDALGNEYVPRHPQPGMVSIPVTAVELLELWWMHNRYAAAAAAGRDPQHWAAAETMAADRLAWAEMLVPTLGGLRHQLPEIGHGGRV